MNFRKFRGIKIPADRQGLIFYTCRNYKTLPTWQQEKIQRLCDDCGGADRDALFEFLTTARGAVAVSMAHSVSETQLYRMRKAFYETW